MMNACASPSGDGCSAYGDRDAPLRAVAQQPLERRQVLRRRDDQDVPDARQHQRRERVVDHRLVVDRQELLADRPGDRMQPRARAAGEDDPLALGRRRPDVRALVLKRQRDPPAVARR